MRVALVFKKLTLKLTLNLHGLFFLVAFRYLTVAVPQKKFFTLFRGVVMVIVIWVVCLVTNSPWFLWASLQPIGPGRYRCARNGPNDPASSTTYSITIRIVNFIIPLLVTWFAYVMILLKLWQTRKKVGTV